MLWISEYHARGLGKRNPRASWGYVANVDTRYLTFMLDFLNTLDYLPEDMAMDQKFVDFLKNRPEGEVEKFLNQINEFKKGLRKKLIRFRSELMSAPTIK